MERKEMNGKALILYLTGSSIRYLSIGSFKPELPKVRHVEKGGSIPRCQAFSPNLAKRKNGFEARVSSFKILRFSKILDFQTF